MAEQKEVLREACETYRGEEEQRDDITVVGCRVTASSA
jgi:serine phosphatase RsbU (regulator of sigma subunit)